MEFLAKMRRNMKITEELADETAITEHLLASYSAEGRLAFLLRAPLEFNSKKGAYRLEMVRGEPILLCVKHTEGVNLRSKLSWVELEDGLEKISLEENWSFTSAEVVTASGSLRQLCAELFVAAAEGPKRKRTQQLALLDGASDDDDDDTQPRTERKRGRNLARGFARHGHSPMRSPTSLASFGEVQTPTPKSGSARPPPRVLEAPPAVALSSKGCASSSAAPATATTIDPHAESFTALEDHITSDEERRPA